jgi:hypothetical protein
VICQGLRRNCSAALAFKSASRMTRIRAKRSLLFGLLWAAFLLIFAWRLPLHGCWTIDDSVKRVAAAQAQGIWAESLNDGPVRAKLPDPLVSAPLRPPFAVHNDGHLTLGFSPWSRALFKMILFGGDVVWRLAPAVIAVAVWAAFEMAGIPWAFLLLPLTFYGLVPWEHALTWLFLLPMILLVSRLSAPRANNMLLWLGAGILLALAVLLRPETAVLFGVCSFFLLFKKRFREFLTFFFGTLLGGGAALIWHAATATQPPLIQIGLNALGKETGFAAWLVHRPQALYALLLSADPSTIISMGILLLLIGGTFCVWFAARRQKKALLACGALLLVAAVGIYQIRLWSSSLPPLMLLHSGSFFIALPWALLLLLPPFRNRPLFWLGAAAMGLVILITPMWSGVHWGPRILLFAVPLFIVDLFVTGRLHGRLFVILLVATAIQTASSAALVYARAQEVSDRVRLAEPVLGKVVICPTTSQCADLAPLWPKREFFTAATGRELRQLLLDMRAVGVDTVWIHASAGDLFVRAAFPDGKPLILSRATHVQARSLYTTAWRIYEFAVNANDTLWAQVLETEAGNLFAEGKAGSALRWQREAVLLTPQSAARHHNLALILWGNGENAAARAEAETTLNLDSSLTKSRRLVAILDSLSESGTANSARP